VLRSSPARTRERVRNHCRAAPFDQKENAEAPMSRSAPNERLAILEQRVSHMEAELARMSAKVDEMHAILLQARGVRWAVITVSGLVGFLAGIAHWFVARV
jgi:hypothetical protein